MVNMVVGLQLLTILLCRGDVYYLGEAYAFGVVWSFVFNSLSLVVMRFKDPRPREFEVPFNVPWKGVRVPVGLGLIFLALALVALANLATKKVATVTGLGATAVFYSLFMYSERQVRARAQSHREKVNLRHETELPEAFSGLTRGNRVLVAVRNPNNLVHLVKVLETADDETTDIVVVCSKVHKGLALEGEQGRMGPDEEHLFTRVIEEAERHGQKVHPVLLVSNDPAYAVAQAAQAVEAQEVVMGGSTKVLPEVQMERFAMTWGSIIEREGSQKPLLVRILWDGKELSATL